MTTNILMSTYNGEKFIEDQLISIQKQTVTDWQLLIRDDGSQDGTQEIIRRYAKADSRIRFINDGQDDNLGVIKSFYNLLTYEAADYYFFSDQDDVWLPDKLEIQLLEAQGRDKSRPLLIYTDLKVVDQDLRVLSESMIRSQSHHANTNLRQELTENTVTGGTMMINRSLADLWTVTDDLLMHDWYLALLAAAFGDLVYLDRPTELYRQHDQNVLGARTWSKRMKNWLRPHLLFEKYWRLIKSSQEQASHLLSLDLSPADRDLVEAFVSLMDQPLGQRLRLLKEHGLAKNRLFHTLIFRSLILTKFAYRRDYHS